MQNGYYPPQQGAAPQMVPPPAYPTGGPVPVQQNYRPAVQQVQGPNDIIARADASKRILDFRNALVVANPVDYAMLHGIGGAKHAPRSGIKCVICDYSKGTGNGKSVNVSANISPDLFPILADIALSNMGEYGISASDGVWGKLSARYREQGAVFGAFYNLLKRIGNLLGMTVNGQIQPHTPPYYGDAWASVNQSSSIMEQCQHPQAQEISPVPFTRDFHHKQTRVNTRGRTRDGFVPVSLLTITRQGYVKGEKRRLPWTFQITNFEARPSGQSNGTTAYDAGSIRNKQECYIQISDEDVHRCATRVNRFVEVWEITTGTALVSNGLSWRERARDEYRRQQSENRC